MSESDMAADLPASRGRLRSFSSANRYGIALLFLMVSYVQALYVSSNIVGSASLMFLQLSTVYLVLSVSESDRIRRVAGVAFLVAAAVLGITLLSGPKADSDSILLALSIVNVLLYAAAPVAILRHIFLRNVVDLQTLLGAVCAYLMIGMFFAFTFSLMTLLTGDPFFTDPAADQLSDYLFFSFVTITTTGYGDLVPASSAGQTLAVWEAILGQFFLAAVVAKIVSSWRPVLRAREAMTDSSDSPNTPDSSGPAE